MGVSYELKHKLTDDKQKSFSITKAISLTFIKDVFSAVGADRQNQTADDSLFGRNLLVDLHLDILGDNQIYTETKDRYVDNYENDPEVREKNSDTIRAELRQRIADIKAVIRYLDKSCPSRHPMA